MYKLDHNDVETSTPDGDNINIKLDRTDFVMMKCGMVEVYNTTLNSSSSIFSLLALKTSYCISYNFLILVLS